MYATMTIANPPLVNNQEVPVGLVKGHLQADDLIIDNLTQRAIVKGYAIDGRLLLDTYVDVDSDRMSLQASYKGVLILAIVANYSITKKRTDHLSVVEWVALFSRVLAK